MKICNFKGCEQLAAADGGDDFTVHVRGKEKKIDVDLCSEHERVLDRLTIRFLREIIRGTVIDACLK